LKKLINTIHVYLDERGKCPCESWLNTLKEAKIKAAVISRVDRMELGLFGDSESVGEGISELRLHIGPGYRIYYAQDGKNIYYYAVGISPHKKLISNLQKAIGLNTKPGTYNEK
jgi:putative addiction module killer protein